MVLSKCLISSYHRTSLMQWREVPQDVLEELSGQAGQVLALGVC